MIATAFLAASQAPGTDLIQPQLDFISARDGVRIPVRIYGRDNASTPVVLSHGLQSHSGWFAQSCSFLADNGFPVYAYDRRGSGLSQEARGDCDDFRTIISDIHSVARHAMNFHATRQAHIFGHCFGAMPAAAFACAHPALTRSLVLATPGIFTKSDLTKSDKSKIIRAQITRKHAPIPAPLPPEVFSEMEQYIEFIRRDELMLKVVTTRLMWQVLRMRRFIARRANRLTMPVFALLAGQDTVCDNARNRLFFGELPSPRKLLIEYSRTRHVLEFGPQKEEVFSDLKWWLAAFSEIK